MTSRTRLELTDDWLPSASGSIATPPLTRLGSVLGIAVPTPSIRRSRDGLARIQEDVASVLEQAQLVVAVGRAMAGPETMVMPNPAAGTESREHALIVAPKGLENRVALFIAFKLGLEALASERLYRGHQIVS